MRGVLRRVRPPVLGWLPHYDTATLLKDASAGVTVFILLIPQGLAYALLGGLPPIYGLYAAGVPLLVYTVFGTSRQLAIGPMAIASLLSGAVVGALRDSDGALLEEESDEWVRASIALALLTGALLLLLGALGVHHLTRGLSGAVLSGFTTGVACVIFLSQLPKLLGLTVERQRYSHQTIVEICLHIPTLNVLALLVGVGAAVALQVTKKWRQQYSPPLSSASTTTTTSTRTRTRWSWSTVLSCLHVASRYSLLVTGVLTTLLSWVVHNYTELSMPIVGSVPRGLPSPQLPSLSPSLHLQLLPGAIMVALITFAGNWAVAKKFAEKNNYAISGRSEMMAYGLCNLVGSMFHSYVVAGGFSRSAVNAEGGALTPLAGFISGVCMLMALQFFTSLFFYLPLATLGAIIVVSVVSMMDFKRILVAYQKGFYQDCVVMLGTLLSTFFAGVTVGLLCGVALSVGGLLLSISTPEFSSQVPTDSGSCASNANEQHVDIATCNSFRLVSMSSLLYFGNLDSFKDAVLIEARAMAQAMTQQRSEFETRSPNTSANEECMLGAIVIDACCWGHYLEMSCATALGELRQDLLKIARTIDTESSHAVILKMGLVNCHPALLKLLGALGVVEELGADMVFSTSEDCFRNCDYRLDCMRRAMTNVDETECRPSSALCIESTECEVAISIHI